MTNPKGGINILLVGDLGPGQLAKSVCRGFEALGCRVEAIDPSAERAAWWLPHNRYTDSTVGAIVRRRWREALRQASDKLRPDLVLVLKGNWVDAATIEAVKKTSGAFANYYPDGPFYPPNASQSFHEALRHYDLVFTLSHSFLPHFARIGATARYLPFAWDPVMHPYSEPTRESACDISFVGNWSEERQLWLDELTDFDLEIWGDWSRTRRWSPIYRFIKGPAQFEEAMVTAIKRAAISLNLIQVFSNGHNMRSFEAPAIGAFVLSRRTPELLEIFREGREIECFETVTELRTKARYYLDHPEERRRISLAAHSRCIRETYTERCAEILRSIFPGDHLSDPAEIMASAAGSLSAGPPFVRDNVPDDVAQ